MDENLDLSQSSFTEWQDFLSKASSNKEDLVEDPKVISRLRRFPFLEQIESPEDVGDSLTMLSQGFALVNAANGEPFGGPQHDGDATDGQKARLKQWRLVMAFGGTEIVSKALILERPPTWQSPRFREFVRSMDKKMKLASRHPLDPLLAPDVTKRVQESFFGEIHLEPGGAMARLLNLNDWDIDLLGRWIKGETELVDWDERLALAKALRNCTAHGALSATKVLKFRFIPAIEQLTTNLWVFTLAVFERLVDRE